MAKTARQLVHDAFAFANRRESRHIPDCVAYGAETHDVACDELTRAIEFDRLRANNERALEEFVAAQRTEAA